MKVLRRGIYIAIERGKRLSDYLRVAARESYCTRANQPHAHLPTTFCRQAGAFSWDKWTHVAVSMDTSRDESSAEVRLFLDGHRVGSGVCRFNKVSQYLESVST